MKIRTHTIVGSIVLLCTYLPAQNAGDLIITEYMANPQDVPNDQGEYIEVYNPTTYPVSLLGCVIQDASDLTVSINDPIWLSPGEFAVLGRNMVPAATYYFPSSPPPFNLNNIGGDQISITCNGTLVAHTNYTDNQQAGVAKGLAGIHLHNNGQTLEVHYSEETYQFQYLGTNSTDYGSPGFAGNTFILPVSLTKFEAASTQEGILLHWETASEFNNSHFTVEHSIDGSHFVELAKIEGAGQSEAPLSYQYLDQSPISGENYYRLSQFDFDGLHSYSEVRPAIFESNEIHLYPTLAEDELTIKLPAYSAKATLVSIYNMYGQKVMEETIPEGVQNYRLKIASLPGGSYCLDLNEHQQRPLPKFVKK